jgi:putative redox protein
MSLETPTVGVRYLGGDRLAITVRGHRITADQPVEEGGEDLGPTPTELFVAGLAGCVGFYAERFMRRRRVSTEGLLVSCAWEWDREPLRVGEIELTVEAPGLTPELQEAFERVIEKCPIHNTLQHLPEVRFRILTPRTTHVA